LAGKQADHESAVHSKNDTTVKSETDLHSIKPKIHSNSEISGLHKEIKDLEKELRNLEAIRVRLAQDKDATITKLEDDLVSKAQLLRDSESLKKKEMDQLKDEISHLEKALKVTNTEHEKQIKEKTDGFAITEKN
jgi:neutral trehalase